MKLLYEADNSIEAHMILNLLEQAGLSGRIDGEILQGGVGELQAIGLVRVMVEENDYADAKKIIDQWAASYSRIQPAVSEKSKGSLGVGIIGFVLGIGLMLIYYHTPIATDGIDYNGDGKLDETWHFVHDLVAKTEVDRNFDGEVDFIIKFDRRGLIKSSIEDNDFNGTFETEISFDFGSVVWIKTDTTGDGFQDYILHYKFGVVDKVHFKDPQSKRDIKIQYYNNFKLQSAEVDTNRDGVLDTQYLYDDIEEQSRTLPITDNR